jgi:hypothetical protein
MSFVKNAQNVAQHMLCQNYRRTFTVERSSSNISTAFVILKPLPETNNHPISKNSPQLVTLERGEKEIDG